MLESRREFRVNFEKFGEENLICGKARSSVGNKPCQNLDKKRQEQEFKSNST
jgi:hypothetical protein